MQYLQSSLNNQSQNDLSTGYNLLKIGNIENNNKKISVEILKHIKTNYIETVGNTPEKIEEIKTQIKSDLLSIYYENYDEKKVKKHIKEQICKAWHIALTIRIKEIVNDAVFLLKKGNTIQKGGGYSISNISMPSMPTVSDVNNYVSGNVGNNVITTDKEQKKREEESKKFQKFIQYKSELIESNYFKNRYLTYSASVSKVDKLHTKIIYKVLCNYAIITRDKLVSNLREIILGKKAIDELAIYKKSVKSTSSTTAVYEKESIYQLFVSKLQHLGDTNNKDKSLPLIRKKELVGGAETGANTSTNANTDNADTVEIPPYIPSESDWTTIENYANEGIQKLIDEKFGKNTPIYLKIKEAFEEVFKQVNCDSLDIESDKNEIITKLLNREYRSMLDVLCRNIPNKTASSILQCYIVRNYDEFTDYLISIFNNDVNDIESILFSYRNISSKFANDDIKPTYPEVSRNIINDSELGEFGKDDCGSVRITSGDVPGVPEFIKTVNIGKEPSISDFMTPAVLLPFFNILEKAFTESSKDKNTFLPSIFDMYSRKSIKFVLQLQKQFSNDDEVHDFIERYILTKHLYTIDIITECIKHTLDMKLTILKMETIGKYVDEEKKREKEEILVKSLSQYATLLIYSILIANPTIDTRGTNPYINYLTDQLIPMFNGLIGKTGTEIKDHIIDKIPTQELKTYDKELRKLFEINKVSVLNRVTRKLKKVNRDCNIPQDKNVIDSTLNPISTLSSKLSSSSYNSSLGITEGEDAGKESNWEDIGKSFGLKLNEMESNKPTVKKGGSELFKSIQNNINEEKEKVIQDAIQNVKNGSRHTPANIFLHFNNYTKQFDLPSFKFISVRGNGNCGFNSVAWWVINYYSFDNKIFDFDPSFQTLLKNNPYVKNPYLDIEKTAENILNLGCNEIIYDKDGYPYNKLIDGVTERDSEEGSKSKILYCTKFAEYLRSLVCGYYKTVAKTVSEKTPFIDNYKTWLDILLNSNKTLPEEVGDYTTHVCTDGKDIFVNDLYVLSYILRINIVCLFGRIGRINDVDNIERTNADVFIEFDSIRPTIYMFNNGGHWSVLYPCNKLYADSIKTLPVAENKDYPYPDDLTLSIIPERMSRSDVIKLDTKLVTTVERREDATEKRKEKLSEFDDLYQKTKIEGDRIPGFIMSKPELTKKYYQEIEVKKYVPIYVYEEWLKMQDDEYNSKLYNIEESINNIRPYTYT